MQLRVEDKIVALAESAATASRTLLKERFGRARPDLMTGEDLKLREDKMSEQEIVSVLSQRSDWPILSEEAGWIGSVPDRDTPYWVVDPLDGSYNFHSGIPMFCVSVAVCRHDYPLLGCVYDILRDELYVGGAGRPLRVNGEVWPIDHRPGAGILASGLPVSRKSSTLPEAFGSGQWKKLRMLGSAALSLAWTATGRLGGYAESGICWWDVAGGLALVQSAGGEVNIRMMNEDEEFDPARPMIIEAQCCLSN